VEGKKEMGNTDTAVTVRICTAVLDGTAPRMWSASQNVGFVWIYRIGSRGGGKQKSYIFTYRTYSILFLSVSGETHVVTCNT
jgi:hypothetical protein